MTILNRRRFKLTRHGHQGRYFQFWAPAESLENAGLVDEATLELLLPKMHVFPSTGNIINASNGSEPRATVTAVIQEQPITTTRSLVIDLCEDSDDDLDEDEGGKHHKRASSFSTIEQSPKRPRHNTVHSLGWQSHDRELLESIETICVARKATVLGAIAHPRSTVEEHYVRERHATTRESVHTSTTQNLYKAPAESSRTEKMPGGYSCIKTAFTDREKKMLTFLWRSLRESPRVCPPTVFD